MAFNLTNIGEEWALKTTLEGVSASLGLYHDATDSLTDASDLVNITTEPADGNYARIAVTLEVGASGGNWEARINADAVFDTVNTTGTVDGYFIVANFTSVEAGDATPTDHLVIAGALTQSRDLSQIDTLTITSGSAGFSLD